MVRTATLTGTMREHGVKAALNYFIFCLQKSGLYGITLAVPVCLAWFF